MATSRRLEERGKHEEKCVRVRQLPRIPRNVLSCEECFSRRSGAGSIRNTPARRVSPGWSSDVTLDGSI